MPRDVAVIGGGVAGLSAALAAAANGADVELIEGGPAVGGAALLSNGSLWTFDSVDRYLTRCPGADPVLAARVVTGFEPAVSWLRDLGMTVAERGPSLYGADRSYQVEPTELVGTLERAVRDRAAVAVDEPMSTLSITGSGVTVTTARGRRIEARTVVLATGGARADARVLRAAGVPHYVGLPSRNRPGGGDGVRVGLDLGGEIAGTRDGVYGHLVPTGLAAEAALSPLAAQYQSWSGVLVDAHGDLVGRPATDDHDLNRELTRRPERRGVLFYDSRARPPRIRSAVGGTDWAADRYAFAEAGGRHAVRSGNVDDLLAAVRGWGVPAVTTAARAAMSATLQYAPFFAVEVEPSMTHSGAGLRVDETLQATGLHGVLVAGQDIGGGFGDGYGGGLAFAITTGIGAGRSATAAAQRTVTST